MPRPTRPRTPTPPPTSRPTPPTPPARPRRPPRSRRSRPSRRPPRAPARAVALAAGAGSREDRRARRAVRAGGARGRHRAGADPRDHLHRAGRRGAARRGCARACWQPGEREAARDIEGAPIGTFHGFCARLLRIHAPPPVSTPTSRSSTSPAPRAYRRSRSGARSPACWRGRAARRRSRCSPRTAPTGCARWWAACTASCARGEPCSRGCRGRRCLPTSGRRARVRAARRAAGALRARLRRAQARARGARLR